jgi:nucleotide-binding universal stress UspA family protein
MMSMKTVLVPTESHDGMQSALETALVLAQRFDSYIEGFALLWGVSDLVAVDTFSGVPVETYKQDLEEEAKRARQTFESFMREHRVPRSSGGPVSLSFGWLDDMRDFEGFVGSYGRVFDVIVMSRPNANSTGRHNRAIESGLFESGRPILLSPPSPPSRIATNALVPWNGSTEQARATALAMPLLQQANRVTVLTVIGGSGVPGPSAEQVIQYLGRNGITAESVTVGLDGGTTGEAILAAATSLGCDLLIKGAYTQSRLRQMIFGGATRHVMMNAALPVLLAH